MLQTITRRHICFASIVEGDVATPQRERCESALFARLSNARVGISMVAVHDGGCAFAVDEYDLADVREAMKSLNLALSVRTRCARVALTGVGAGASNRTVSAVLGAIAEAGIGLIHLSSGVSDVTVLVAERDAARAQALMSGAAISSRTSV